MKLFYSAAQQQRDKHNIEHDLRKEIEDLRHRLDKYSVVVDAFHGDTIKKYEDINSSHDSIRNCLNDRIHHLTQEIYEKYDKLSNEIETLKTELSKIYVINSLTKKSKKKEVE